MSNPSNLPATTLREVSRVSDRRGALDLISVWGGIALAMALAATLDAVWAWAAAVAFIGVRQAALANLAHDAWHDLCFSSRQRNHAVGAWLYAYPIGLPYQHDRRRHLQHHRLVGRPEDPDWRNYTSEGRETPGRLVGYLTSRLLGGLLLETAWQVVGRAELRIQVNEDARAEPLPVSPMQEMLRVALCQVLLLLVLGLTVAWWAYFVLWLLPLMTVCAFCVSVRAFVEHVADSPEASPEDRLRDQAVGPLERFVFSPCHFDYHALHHAHASIPHYRLPRAKQELIGACGRYPHAVGPGYLRSLARHLQRLPLAAHDDGR